MNLTDQQKALQCSSEEIANYCIATGITMTQLLNGLVNNLYDQKALQRAIKKEAA